MENAAGAGAAQVAQDLVTVHDGERPVKGYPIP